MRSGDKSKNRGLEPAICEKWHVVPRSGRQTGRQTHSSGFLLPDGMKIHRMLPSNPPAGPEGLINMMSQ
eukprot:7156346-Pyramimonas_sp.AAC.1